MCGFIDNMYHGFSGDVHNVNPNDVVELQVIGSNNYLESTGFPCILLAGGTILADGL